jgi:hypothetical protein
MTVEAESTSTLVTSTSDASISISVTDDEKTFHIVHSPVSSTSSNEFTSPKHFLVEPREEVQQKKRTLTCKSFTGWCVAIVLFLLSGGLGAYFALRDGKRNPDKYLQK